MLDKMHELENRYLHINNETKISNEINVGVNLTGIEQKVILVIQKNSNIATPEIAKLCEVSTRTIERTIKSLKEKRRIERIGSDKTGHWVIK